jgi:hypothetical protein
MHKVNKRPPPRITRQKYFGRALIRIQGGVSLYEFRGGSPSLVGRLYEFRGRSLYLQHLGNMRKSEALRLCLGCEALDRRDCDVCAHLHICIRLLVYEALSYWCMRP